MKFEELESLNAGYVIERFKPNEKVCITVPRSANCGFCKKELTKIKCLVHTKGTKRLIYECFECYSKSLEK